MGNYQQYKLQIELTSSIITPFQSDTIFGHICWAIHQLDWGAVNDKLQQFLNAYDAKDTKPPLLVSDGFPENHLPKPVLPSVSQEELDKKVPVKKRIDESYRIKSLKKLKYVTRDDFEKLQQKEINSSNLFDILYNSSTEKYDETAFGLPFVVQHNTIDRIADKVTEGLYSETENFFSTENNKYEIYISATDFFTKVDLERIFEYISLQGFGKNKSTGKGAFNILDISEQVDLPKTKNPNGFITLSSYIPRKNDPAEGYYNTLLKFGKLGGTFATGSLKVGKNPFKKPLIMMCAGSIFKDNEYYEGKIYGSLLQNIHKNTDIRHYAHAFPLGIRIGGPNGNN